MTATLTRRALFSRLRGGPPQLRPPWAKSEARFVEACTACGECIAACPAGILLKGHAGYPIVSFGAAGCTFCGKCADVCEADAFLPRSGQAWRLQAAISGSCVEAKGVSCRMCEEACPSSAIRFKPQRGGTTIAIVDAATCTGCGACVGPCPVKAISIADPAKPMEAV